MKRALVLSLIAIATGCEARADGLGPSETLYAPTSVQTDRVRILLKSFEDGARFSISLIDTQLSFEKSYVFEGEGANDPSPYRMEVREYCGTSAIFLTINYPWRHSLPLYSPVLETYAFRESDFELIDITLGAPTEISLLDADEENPSDSGLFPSIAVRCLPETGDRPFEFVLRKAE